MDKPQVAAHVAALLRAIEISGGSQAALAKRLSKAMDRPIKQQHVSYWLKHEVLLEPDYWPAFESVTDQKVTRRHLRPDVFGGHKAA